MRVNKLAVVELFSLCFGAGKSRILENYPCYSDNSTFKELLKTMDCFVNKREGIKTSIASSGILLIATTKCVLNHEN